jgi:hypothetical protein
MAAHRPKRKIRTLVDISPYRRQQLETIRGECERCGKRVPTLPDLVERALERSMDWLASEFLTKHQ